MASDWDYTYAVARIRVLETHLLTDSDISTLVSSKDAESALAFLRDKGWGDSTVSASDPEAILALETQKTWKVMKELGVDSDIFNVLSFPNLYHNLKAAIKEICTSEENPTAFFADEKYGRDKMLGILKEKNYSALPEHMQSCASVAYDTMLHTMDGQLCDVIADRGCLDAIESEGQKAKDKIIRDYAGSYVAVTDIKIAVRGERTKKSLEFFHQALAPCKSFDVRALAQAAFSGEDSLMDFLKSFGFSEAAEALNKSPSAFERWCDNQTIETIKPQKYEVCTAGPLVAYVLARENEIRTARIVLTCKANHLAEADIRERTREMYV